MKTIFTETNKPIENIVVKYYDYDDDRVYTDRATASVTTNAYYDARMRVLVVDQECNVSPMHWRKHTRWPIPAPRRTLETHDTAAQAIRRTIELADEYDDYLSKIVFDDERSDAEIRAAETELNPYAMQF